MREREKPKRHRAGGVFVYRLAREQNNCYTENMIDLSPLGEQLAGPLTNFVKMSAAVFLFGFVIGLVASSLIFKERKVRIFQSKIATYTVQFLISFLCGIFLLLVWCNLAG